MHETVSDIQSRFLEFSRIAHAPQDAALSEEDVRTWRTSLALLAAIHPDLAAAFRVVDCDINMRVWVDREGNVADATSKPDQRVKLDMSSRMVIRPGSHDVEVTVNPPDIVTKGPLHEAFMKAIREPESIDAMANSIDPGETNPSLPPLVKQHFKQFVLGQHDRALFVRIGRDPSNKDSLDYNLVSLEGEMDGETCWMLFRNFMIVKNIGEQRFKVTSRNAVFHACELDGKLYYAPSSYPSGDWTHVRAYVPALVHTLVSWHNVIRQGGRA